MAVTIQQVLSLESFRLAGVSLAAGESGKHRLIRRAHIARTLQNAEQPSDGEFVLTGDLLGGAGNRKIEQFVTRLDQAGAAGLAVELGPGQVALPEPLVAEAERRSLPVLVLPYGTPFSVLAAQLDHAVLADQHDRLAKVEQIGRTFTDLDVCACGTRPSEILDRLAELLCRPLIMFDEFGHAMEIRGDVGTDVLTRHDHKPDVTPGPRVAELPVSVGENVEHCLWMPLMLRGVSYGSVHVLATERPFDEIDVVALDRAMAALSNAVLLRQHDQRLALQAQRSLVADLVAGRRPNEKEFAQRARALGTDMEGMQLAAAVLTPVASGEGVTDAPEWQLIVECLTAAAESHNCAVLCGGTAETTIAVFGLPETDILTEVASDTLRRLQRYYPPGAAIGTCPADLNAFSHAFDTATRLANYGVQRSSGVYPAEEFRLELLFHRLNGSVDLTQFVRSEIGPLLEHDTRSSRPLMPTLRTYISSGCSKTVTAQRLHIVRRTLYRRLTEIEKLLGRDLHDGETIMRLSLAVWSWDARSRS
jgi:PucR family transcriptional regulator, purine catabolism regulatory protein